MTPEQRMAICRAMELIENHDEFEGNSPLLDQAYEELQKVLDLEVQS